MLVLSMFGNDSYNYQNKGSFGSGDIYVNRNEIVTVSETLCVHWEGHVTLFTSDSHLVTEKCTELSLKNGEIIHVKEKAKDILNLEKVCK